MTMLGRLRFPFTVILHAASGHLFLLCIELEKGLDCVSLFFYL